MITLDRMEENAQESDAKRQPYERPFYVRPNLKDFVELAQRKQLAQQARHTMENAMTVCIIAPGSSGECLGDRLEKQSASA